jgi:hypothetical protein
VSCSVLLKKLKGQNHVRQCLFCFFIPERYILINLFTLLLLLNITCVRNTVVFFMSECKDKVRTIRVVSLYIAKIHVLPYNCWNLYILILIFFIKKQNKNKKLYNLQINIFLLQRISIIEFGIQFQEFFYCWK